MYLDEEKKIKIGWEFVETLPLILQRQFPSSPTARWRMQKTDKTKKKPEPFSIFRFLQLDFSAAASLKTLLSWSVFSDWYTRQGEACNCMEKSENFEY